LAVPNALSVLVEDVMVMDFPGLRPRVIGRGRPNLSLNKNAVVAHVDFGRGRSSSKEWRA
jgi:hypothetical protein